MKRRKRPARRIGLTRKRYIMKSSDIVLMTAVAILNITECILSFLSDSIFIKIIGAVFILIGIFAAMKQRWAYIALAVVSVLISAAVIADIYSAGFLIFIIEVARIILALICQNVLSDKEQLRRSSYEYY